MDYTLDGEELFKKIILNIPKFLQSNILLYGVICFLIVKIISIVVFINFPKNIFFADITKTALISLVNQERLSLGLFPLEENQKLDQAALLKAKDILEKDYFSHQSPEGITPWYWFSRIGYNYKYAGENLAIGFLNSEDVHKAWIDSVSHKNNIINPNYKEVGIAVLTGEYKGNNSTVIVQFFGNPKTINMPVAEKTVERIIKVEEQPVNVEVLSQFTEAPLQEDNITHYKFLDFVFYNSDKIFEYTTYFLLILTGIALLLNILINFDIQDKKLILRSLIIIILLFTALLINKETVNKIIPYEIII